MIRRERQKRKQDHKNDLDLLTEVHGSNISVVNDSEGGQLLSTPGLLFLYKDVARDVSVSSLSRDDNRYIVDSALRIALDHASVLTVALSARHLSCCA